jgi:flagellar P-ring protein precursor FlgI
MRFFILISIFISQLYSASINQIAEVVGVRENQLIGYGLVVGLNGTGDSASSFYAYQSMANMLQLMNVKVDPATIKSKNVASVMVTAKLPSFTRQGDKISVIVSSIGDSKSLEGGTLIMTPLKGVDGAIYALAQGSVSVGGLAGRGGGEKHITAGRIPDGALVEREIPFDFYGQDGIKLSLKEASFTNAIATEKAINLFFKNDLIAKAIDSKTIVLKKPKDMSMIRFLAEVENININYKVKSKIIINERTGTVVAGVNVEIAPVVITHGKITIKIGISNNLPVANENTLRLDDEVAVDRNGGRVLTKKNNIANITRSLKKLGAEPQDIISIIQAMKQAGAIQADLEVI